MKNVKVNIKALAKALDNGIFLYLVEKSEKIKEIITSLSLTLKKVNIERKNNSTYYLQGGSIIASLVHALLYVISGLDKKEVTLDDLRDLAKLFTDEVTRNIILNEIDRIEEKVTEEEKRLLSEYFQGEKGFDTRILYAHGGLPAAGLEKGR